MTRESENKRIKSDYPAPTKNPRGLDRADGFRKLAAAVLGEAVKTVRESRDPKMRWDSLTWLCSDAAELMTDFLGLLPPGHLLKSGRLLREEK